MNRILTMSSCTPKILLAATVVLGLPDVAASQQLIGHWQLDRDVVDRGPGELPSVGHDVTFSDEAALLNGTGSYIEVPDPALNLGVDDFTISVWIHTENALDDVPGDILSYYDPATRVGFNLGIQNFAGVTSSQSNYRHLYFGIDQGNLDPEWTDCGRPGESLFAYSLCVYQGQLYVGTFETRASQSGHVYRYAGGTEWVDCGSPDRCNTVQSLAVYRGQLYAGVSRYESRGSALPDSPNLHDGGRIYRYEGGAKWIDCGKLVNDETGDSFTVGGLAVFQDRLYAGVSKSPGRGFYRYDGGRDWKYCGNPDRRVTNPVVFNGSMYLTSLDKAHVNRYDGPHQWTYCGVPEGASQTYGFAIYGGNLYTSTWPNGEVFRYEPTTQWVNTGRLGTEKEVMGMVVYNGKLYAGTLPLAEVYRYDGDNHWTSTGQLDRTPDVKYRRAWSMAVHGGKLFCGTLPSGHIFSLEAGKCVTYDHALPTGWVHVAAVKGKDRLHLYVNGQPVSVSTIYAPDRFHLSHPGTLKIGFGPQDYFKGRIRDLRIYRGAAGGRKISELASSNEP